MPAYSPLISTHLTLTPLSLHLHPPACLPPTRLQKLAEKHLPALPDKGGRALPVAATDLRSGHSHALQFKFWANPNSRGR